MSEKSEKTRGKNYTEREKLLLLSIIDKYKSIIENKCTNAVFTNEKNKAWEQVTKEFNSCAQETRESRQLQAAYNNLKRKTRQDVASENVKKYTAKKRELFSKDIQAPSSSQDMDEVMLKKYKKDEIADKKAIKATGGGTYTPMLSEVGAQVLAVMGNQVKPLYNSYDSASKYFADDNIVIMEDVGVNVPLTPIECNVTISPSGTIVPDDGVDDDVTVSEPMLPKKKVVPKKIAVPKRRYFPKKGNTSTETIKKQYYRKKLECAMIEKKSRIAEHKLFLKKQVLVDIEIKIKTAEYEKLKQN